MKAHVIGDSLISQMGVETLSEYLNGTQNDEATLLFVDRTGKENKLNFGEIKSKARNAASQFLRMGIKSRDPLILQISDPQAFIISFWACIYSGIIPVPVTTAAETQPNISNQKVKEIMAQLGCHRILVEEELLPKIDPNILSQNHCILYEEVARAGIAEAGAKVMSIHPGKEDVAYIQYSSGSTNFPKGIVLTHDNLLSNAEQIAQRLELTKRDVGLSWMPLTHDMGLVGFHITPFLKGVNHMIMSPMNFIKAPLNFYKIAEKNKATIIGMPNFAFDWSVHMVKDQSLEGLDLSDLRAILNGAEPVNTHSIQCYCEKFRAAGLKSESILPVYGMAEACIAVTIPCLRNHTIRVEKVQQQGREYVALGEPLPGVEIKIMDENGNLTSEGQVGDVFIKGPNITSGYFKNEQANRACFHQDYLWTQDMGFVKDGRLFITGRKKDMFIMNGQNCYLSDIDLLLQENGIKNAVAVYEEERNHLVVYIKTKRKDVLPQTAELIKKIITGNYRIAVEAVLPVESIPKTTSGKVQRYALVKMYQQSEL